MKYHSNIPKYEEFKFLNECQIQFDLILESLKSARKLYLDTDKISNSIFNMLTEYDISPTKKYLEKMCKWWAEHQISATDHIRDSIAIYDNLCNKKLIKETDINSFKTFKEFYEFVIPKKDLSSKAEEKEKIKTKEADVILDDDRWFIISPLTHGASCIFGAGTKWCTTMKDPKYWNQYTSKFVKFYYCLDKQSDKDESDMYKFAVAVYPDGTKECYDAQDDPFNFKEVLKLGLKEDIFKAEEPTLEKVIPTWFNSTYTIDEEGFYNTRGSVEIRNWKGKQLPIKFGTVGSVFRCSGVGLETLEGCPKECFSIMCNDNNLKSMEYCPKCYNVNCENNFLISLKGVPKVVDEFDCSGNSLKDLSHGPEIAETYRAGNNKINSLKGFPKKVSLDFVLYFNQLRSFDGFKTEVGGSLYCRNNPLPKDIQKPESVKKQLNFNLNL